MSDGFTEKLIELTITLGTGNFGADLGDTVTISNARIFVDVSFAGGDTMGNTKIRVFGLSQQLMNQLTTIGQINRAIRVKNTVSVAAGDENGLQLVFAGVIVDAWADYNASPDVPFIIEAAAGMDVAVKPVNSTSYKGNTPVTQIMQDLATEAGLAFESSGVDVQLFSPYLAGATLSKIRQAARAAGIEYTIDRGTLAIWSIGRSRESEVPMISVDSGMIGYPELSSKGMTVRCVFNQNIKFGADVKVQSTLEMANGIWHVFHVSHSISSQAPDGPWMTTIEVYRVEP
jgi:hypothetical protein